MKNIFLPALIGLGGACLFWALLQASTRPDLSALALASKAQMPMPKADAISVSKPTSFTSSSERSFSQSRSPAAANESFASFTPAPGTFSSAARQNPYEIKTTSLSSLPARATAPAKGSAAYSADGTSSPAMAPAAADSGLALAPGVPAPIVLSDTSSLGPLTAPQADAINQTANNLVERVQQAPDQNLDQTFDAESANADSIYRNLFGESQYIQQSMSTVIEAGIGSR